VFRSDPVLILPSFAGLSIGALTLLRSRIQFSQSILRCAFWLSLSRDSVPVRPAASCFPPHGHAAGQQLSESACCDFGFPAVRFLYERERACDFCSHLSVILCLLSCVPKSELFSLLELAGQISVFLGLWAASQSTGEHHALLTGLLSTGNPVCSLVAATDSS
jgi:hypothetical protein